jgi:uncharacterized protein (UPF0276 family)
MHPRDAGALGVGIIYNPAVPALLPAPLDIVDYVEVIPEGQWEDLGEHRAGRYRSIATAEEALWSFAGDLPVVGHGVGLSIGSAGVLDHAHLDRIRRWLRDSDCRRFSEHLTFAQVVTENTRSQVGVGLPLPCDRETLDWLVERVDAIQQALGISLLLENGVSYAPVPDQELGEAVFLSELAARSGCGILLDLHNLYVDCRNHGWSAQQYVSDLDLDHVREIHVAGGAMLGGMYTDAHSGSCPPAVWDLAHDVVPRCLNLEGLTFEFHESYAAVLGADGLCDELRRARSCWDLRSCVGKVAVCR